MLCWKKQLRLHLSNRTLNQVLNLLSSLSRDQHSEVEESFEFALEVKPIVYSKPFDLVHLCSTVSLPRRSTISDALPTRRSNAHSLYNQSNWMLATLFLWREPKTLKLQDVPVQERWKECRSWKIKLKAWSKIKKIWLWKLPVWESCCWPTASTTPYVKYKIWLKNV